MKALEYIFSVKNDRIYKVITILGFKIKCKSSALITRLKFEQKFSELEAKISVGAKCEIKRSIDAFKLLLKNIDDFCRQENPCEKVCNSKDGYNTIIPVVLASDENYAPYMYVTIQSIIDIANESSFYDFYLLVPENFPDSIFDIFYDLLKNYKNININFINMGNEFSSLEKKIAHITSPTYYRLKIADLLPEYDKAIYLDTDVIVKSDLAEYFNIDLEDNFIAGVNAAGYILRTNNRKYYKENGLEDLSHYINAGVTLWNLSKIRNENYTAKLCEMAKNNYNSQDQDVINIAFQGKIKILPLKYNFMTKYEQDFINPDRELHSKFNELYLEANIQEALNNPVIIHYADKIKPWNNENVFMAKYWWQTARKTPFYIYFIMDLAECKINQKGTCK